MIGRRRKRRFDFEINRTKFLLFCFFVVFSVVLSRLFYLQVVKGDEYHQIAISQRSSKVEIPARRGEILVKDPTTGELVKLATNTTLDLLYVDPFVTPDKKLVAEKLTPLLFNEEDYKECLANTDYCPKSSLEYVEYEYEEEDGVKIDKRPIPPASYDIALKALENDVFVKINKEDVDFVVLARALSVEHMDKIEKVNIYGIGLNKKGRLVYADPTKIPENQRKDIAKRLNEVLETDYDLLIRRLTGGKLRYVMLGRKLNPDVSEKIIEMKKAYKDVHLKDKRRIFLAKTEEKPIPDYFRGVALTPEHFRYYPDGALASQVIGFVNHEGVGQYGIEGKLNNLLSGKKGVIESQNDILGNGITSGTENIRDAENGASVVLTIDRIVQNHIEEILAEAVEKYRADSGQIVVMEPFTGDIIAMANYPTFDPNSFGNVYKTRRTTPEDAKNIFKTTPLFKKNDDDVLVRTTFDDFDKAWRIGFDPEFYIYENKLGPASYVNKTVQETYEPGSVFKPIAMAAGLDAREVTPSTRFLEDGPLEVGEFTIKTALNEYRGWQTMTNVIETSSNVGMAFVAEKLGRAVFYRYIMDFGFGKYTDIELENEVEGQVKYYKSWSDALLFTASYGQGIT
ncbi:MAG: penicillin-binding transpeptidase domain-containing protein, partial [Candidatus Gracilibacteria bacterium]|nr:penicillin-binding transpeptidase domain-containing protein [Candidatus Gracilibacteria bacterium]